MNKKFRKLIFPVSILLASQAYALGLGSVQINSALDETLDGEIPIIMGSGEDIEQVKVSLASSADYDRVGLDKAYVPSNIVVNIAEKDGAKFIEISSKGPVKEPIVSLLLVVDWANGQLLREYTILLDPPLFNNVQKQQTYSKPVQTQSYETPKQVANTYDDNQTIPQIAPSNQSSDQVVVEAGDTLWKIATRHNDGYNSTQQTMLAIFNNNPGAFQNNDMNFLKKGAVLKIPGSDDIATISNSQAIAEVKSHTQKWSRMQTSDDISSSDSSSSIVDYGIELVPPNDSDSSKSGNSSGSAKIDNGKTLAKLSQAKEDLASSNLENKELSSRVTELERIVKDQELALSLKDTNLAQLQQQLAVEEDIEPDNIATDSTDDVWDEEQLATTDLTVQDEAVSVSSDDTLDADTIIDDSISDSQDLDIVFDENDPIADTTDIQDQDDTTTETNDSVVIADIDTAQDETNEAQKQEQPIVVVPPKKQPSLLDTILSYKYEGLGALLLAGLGFMYYKRRKDSDAEDISQEGDFLDSISNKSTDVDEVKETIDDLEADTIAQEQDEEPTQDEPEVVVMDDKLNVDESVEDFALNIDEATVDKNYLQEDTSDGSTELEDLNFDDSSLDEEDSDELSLDFELDGLDDNLDAEDSTEQLLEDDFNLDLDIEPDENNLIGEPIFDTKEGGIVNDADTSEHVSNEALDGELEDLEFDLNDDLFTTDDLDLEEDLTDNDEQSDELNVEETTPVSDDSEIGVVSIDLDDSKEVDIGLDFDDFATDDAVDTKLDLARAYFEMGDIDGAKQMVAEILEEGTDKQKSTAQELQSEIENS